MQTQAAALEFWHAHASNMPAVAVLPEALAGRQGRRLVEAMKGYSRRAPPWVPTARIFCTGSKAMEDG